MKNNASNQNTRNFCCFHKKLRRQFMHHFNDYFLRFRISRIVGIVVGESDPIKTVVGIVVGKSDSITLTVCKKYFYFDCGIE